MSGEVHGLVGENGAGKSTLAKIISGAYAPDRGWVEIDGQRMLSAGTRMHAKAGVAMIYQEPSIIPGMSALENVFLGQDETRKLVVNSRKSRARFRKLGEEFGVDV